MIFFFFTFCSGPQKTSRDREQQEQRSHLFSTMNIYSYSRVLPYSHIPFPTRPLPIWAGLGNPRNDRYRPLNQLQWIANYCVNVDIYLYIDIMHTYTTTTLLASPLLCKIYKINIIKVLLLFFTLYVLGFTG